MAVTALTAIATSIRMSAPALSLCYAAEQAVLVDDGVVSPVPVDPKIRDRARRRRCSVTLKAASDVLCPCFVQLVRCGISQN
jgi:hypothetical protein